MEYTGKLLGQELIDWAIRGAETAYKGQISVIMADRFANMHPGDAGKTPLALTYYVPKTQEGVHAAKTFIIDGVGYDYWALPWERLEGIADMEETIAFVLAEGEVVWAESEEDRARFYALKERLFRNLSDIKYVCRILADRLNEAMEIYKSMSFEDDIGKLRMGARFVGESLSDAIAAVNGTYIKCGEHGTDDPVPLLSRLRRVPDGYIDLQKKLCTAKDGEELTSLCRGMIRTVRRFLTELLPEQRPEKTEYPVGWYEELIYTWRRIKYFCDRGDAANAFGWGAYLQLDMRVLGDLLTDDEQNILRDFDHENLSRFAERAEEARALVHTRLRERGVRICEYETLDAFLRENGYDEV